MAWFDEAVLNGNLAQRLNGKLGRIVLLLVAAYLILGSFRPVMDHVDLGWHVAQGRWMAEHVAVYRHDAMNYPNLGHAAVDEYPLFQFALYGAWKLGWWGPCLLTALGYAALAGALALGAKGLRVEGSALLGVTLATAILYLQIAFPLRPHLATYICIVMLGVFLLRHREAASWIEFWPIALLQVAWTNSHSAFVIGPAMVGLFGAEMTVRHSIRDHTVAWKTGATWGGAFLFVLLACLVNPFGFARFGPPLYQDQLESIRAYVGEMEPLAGASASLYGTITLLAATAVILAAGLRRGAISWSFLVLALFFYVESLVVKKAWPIFGLFPPLLILSSGAFAGEMVEKEWRSWASLFGNFLVAAFLALVVTMRIDGSPGTSLQSLWREFAAGRSEQSLEAAAWMKAHGLEGRLLHRCEDGACLQLAGYDKGETFGDTGFGKYDEAFIHTLGLLSERPALLPYFLLTYRPDFVICGNFCYQWAAYLRQQGWRPIFYSPNSSVWAQPSTRTDLPTFSDEAIKAAFTNDLAAHGRPVDLLLFGRNLVALNSMGLEDFAFQQLTSLPSDLHHAPWYWEAARMLCFEPPLCSVEHRRQLIAEADALNDPSLTAEFRAYARDADGDAEGARQILAALPPEQLGGHAMDLLLKIDFAENRPEAVTLAHGIYGFDLRDGRRWAYRAMAEERVGHQQTAGRAWMKAVFYSPDEPEVLENAGLFATRFHDAELQRDVTESIKLQAPPK